MGVDGRKKQSEDDAASPRENLQIREFEGLTLDGQLVLFWRLLHLLISRQGSQPMGQLLVALTMVFLNERGLPPTLTDLCEATGLPKSSVSRYVSWQIEKGYAEEIPDPDDRRRRRLKQTRKGKNEWLWELKQMNRLFNEVRELDMNFRSHGTRRDGRELLERMKELTRAVEDFSRTD